jgi:hypothetical protein
MQVHGMSGRPLRSINLSRTKTGHPKKGGPLP